MQSSSRCKRWTERPELERRRTGRRRRRRRRALWVSAARLWCLSDGRGRTQRDDLEVRPTRHFLRFRRANATHAKRVQVDHTPRSMFSNLDGRPQSQKSPGRWVQKSKFASEGMVVARCYACQRRNRPFRSCGIYRRFPTSHPVVAVAGISSTRSSFSDGPGPTEGVRGLGTHDTVQ